MSLRLPHFTFACVGCPIQAFLGLRTLMAKLSRCPGCKKDFLNGRAYSVHLTCCKALGSATDSAIKKHRINAARKTQAKRLEIAVRKGLASQGIINQAVSALDDQEMDTDVNESEVPVTPNSPSPPPRASGRPN